MRFNIGDSAVDADIDVDIDVNLDVDLDFYYTVDVLNNHLETTF